MPIPSVLCFDHNYEETVSFFGDLSARLCRSAQRARMGMPMPARKRTWHDFSVLEFISPSAALVLAAEYDRGRILANQSRLFTINMDKWKDGTRRTLTDLGFLSLLGIDSEINSDISGKHIVRFRSDTRVKMDVASATFREVIQLAVSAAGVMVGDDVLENFRIVLLAIGEALTNTSDHAYPAEQPTDLPNVGRWWITGAVDPTERRLTFTVYDQGISIPRAIPHGQKFEKVQRFFQRLSGRDLDPMDVSLDGQSIASAVRAGASGTGLDHRGKGLGLMRSCIRRERSGQLRIISRNGDYVACSGRTDQQRTRQAALRGTLVEWTVDL